MRILSIIFLILYSKTSFSHEADLLRSLDAKEVLQLTKSSRISGNIYTPIAIRFIKNINSAPSCVLINKNNYRNMVDLASPEESSFLPNCSSNIANPLIFSVGGAHFGLYRYSIEDPRHVMMPTETVVSIGENEIIACDNDDELLKFARSKPIKTGLKKSLISAVEAIGCKPR